MSEWISVAERLPPNGTQVLVACDTGYVTAGWQWFGKWNGEGITHWMPMPEPPGEEGE
jgi:hypothetical protein